MKESEFFSTSAWSIFRTCSGDIVDFRCGFARSCTASPVAIDSPDYHGQERPKSFKVRSESRESCREMFKTNCCLLTCLISFVHGPLKVGKELKKCIQWYLDQHGARNSVSSHQNTFRKYHKYHKSQNKVFLWKIFGSLDPRICPEIFQLSDFSRRGKDQKDVGWYESVGIWMGQHLKHTELRFASLNVNIFLR